MRLHRVLVRNFRGVRYAELSNLSDVVVIAGQNGSGKSCLLDAIRLVKSVYGGYQQNEYHHWFGEFQINFSNDPKAFVPLFNNPSEPLIIEVDVVLHPDERDYLKTNAAALITAQAWRIIVPELYGWKSLNAAPLAAQYRSREGEVKARAIEDLKIFNKEMESEVIKAIVYINPNEQPKFNTSKVLEIVFSTFDPENIGIIDYHGAQRHFGREAIGSINVNFEDSEEQGKQSALYNYNNKYSNVKSEMASLYVREALAEKAGGKIGGTENITKTLMELFNTFFPHKEFLGPQPSEEGRLRFPVRVGGAEMHDLDELSSGEKEILYGYLRMRSSARKNSVILLDEPELHLNPRLTKNLPGFYYRNLSTALNNQVWLITHSDAILRESVGQDGFSVFHVTSSAHNDLGLNQATRVLADQDLERAVIELVGDLAAYSPGGRVVIFEGEDSEFDLWMTSELFPELAERANLISGTNKARVRGLHDLLQGLSDAGRLPKYRVFSITDKDYEQGDLSPINQFKWDSYHIENYLLSDEYITNVVKSVNGNSFNSSVSEVSEKLYECASDTIQTMLIQITHEFVNGKLVNALNVKIDPNSKNITGDMVDSVSRARNRIDSLTLGALSLDGLTQYIDQVRVDLESDLISGAWRKNFNGRSILNRFVAKYGNGISYKNFRNLIVAEMRANSYRPAGMGEILEKVMLPTPLDGTAKR
jgi:predicted ATPase